VAAFEVFSMLVLWLLFLVFMGLAGLVLFASFSNKKAEQYLPPSGQFAKLKTARVHYVDQGQGPVLVLVHGLAGNLHNFTYAVSTPLSENYRVISVDRPGCGYSTRDSQADASLEAQADTLVELLDHLNIESAVFVGHSLGGAISLAAAQRHPARITALALIAPLTHMPEETLPVFKALDIASPSVRQFVGWTFAIPGTLYRMSKSLKIIFGPEKAPRDFAIRGGGIMALKPQTFITASSDIQNVAWSMPNIEAAYASMTTPVHVLYGREDRILSAKLNGEDLPQRLSGTQLTLISGGHMLPVTQAEVTCQFISGVAGKATGLAP
jgi:pimeloyl-ACP methyl ester carboxylesterase